MRILAISGSLRAASYNTALLRAAAELAPEDVTIELYEGLGELPHYSEDTDGELTPPQAARLREAIAGADAVVIATPEYNTTMPSQVKGIVDWGSRPDRQSAALWGKPVLVIGASVTDYGAMWAQDHLRKALGIAGARVLEGDLPVARAHERFDAEGRLVDPETRARLAELLDELASHRDALAQAA
jgi:chromate reductase, NAD(P)H dehydrogenase (quinone)